MENTTVFYKMKNKSVFEVITWNDSVTVKKWDIQKKQYVLYNKEFKIEPTEVVMRIKLDVLKNNQVRRYGPTHRHAKIYFLTNDYKPVTEEEAYKFIKTSFDYGIEQKIGKFTTSPNVNDLFGTYQITSLGNNAFEYFSEEPYLD